MRQEALDGATDWTNTIVDGGKKLKTVHSRYDLLITGTDNMTKVLGEAKDKYDKKVVAAGAKLVDGARQSKNQFVSTSSIMYGTAVDMSEKTKLFLDTAHAKWEEEALKRGNKGGGSGVLDTWSIGKEIRDMQDAAAKQRQAAVDMQLATQRIRENNDSERTSEQQFRQEMREQQEAAINKMLESITGKY